ncbi:Neuromedin-U receptor 2, partial [Ophiophagus hannah]
MDCTTNISQYVHRMEESEPLRKYFNSTEDYLLFLYGPKHSHLSLPVTWIYALIFIVGVSGNLLVCLVILKHRNMKTPTNCYLFSLAISDLLVLLFGMPLEVYEMWSNYPFLFGLVGCYLKTAFFETVCFASILIITMVSIERYMAVLHPFRARLKNTQQRALRIILILWFLSVLFSLPNTSVHGIVLQYFPNHTEVPGSAICAVVKSMWIYNWIIQLTSLLFYVLPMSVISVLYCLMGLKLRRDRSLEIKEMQMNIKLSSRKSITKMLAHPGFDELGIYQIQKLYTLLCSPSLSDSCPSNRFWGMLGPIPHRSSFLQLCYNLDRTSCKYIQPNSCGFSANTGTLNIPQAIPHLS